MRVKVVQFSPDRHPGGVIAFQVIDPHGALSGRLVQQVEIAEPSAGALYLDPHSPARPWRPDRFSFVPPGIGTDGTNPLIEVGNEVTFHLRANKVYKMRLGLSDGSWSQDLPFVMPDNLRLSSTPPAGWSARQEAAAPPLQPLPPHKPAPVEPSGGAIAVEPLPKPEPVTPAPEPSPPAEAPDNSATSAAVTAPMAPASAQAPVGAGGSKGTSGLLIGALVAVLLLAALGAAGWFYLQQAGGAGPVLAGAGGGAIPKTVDACRQKIRDGVSPSEARDVAVSLAKSGGLVDCQFLMLKFAADKGDAVSARLMGRFYDPETWSKDKSPMPEPNATEAARWHRQAAEGGDAEGMYRYAMLLRLQRVEEPDAEAKAEALLRQAAEMNFGPAKDALAQK